MCPPICGTPWPLACCWSSSSSGRRGSLVPTKYSGGSRGSIAGEVVSRLILEHVPAFWVVTLITAGINTIITMGLYFSNAAGALSAAHAAIGGMGAYVGAVLTTNFDWPFLLALLAGVLVGFLTGMLLALVTLRMNEL